MDDDKCWYPLPHRYVHGRNGWCSCICQRPAKHLGKHRCERQLEAESAGSVLVDGPREEDKT